MYRPIAFAFLAVSAAGCQSPSSPRTPAERLTALPRALSPAEQSIVDATSSFAFALTREVNRAWEDRNLFVSPLSASMALSMTMNGANGSTLGEMRSALGFGSRPTDEINRGYQGLIALLQGLDTGVQFDLANAIWYEQAIAPAFESAFLNDARQYFAAEVRAMDFRAPTTLTAINDWVSSRTKGKIGGILDNVPPELVMLLANAIYYKGDWRDPFDKTLTAPAPFTGLTGQQRTVPTMQRTGPTRLARMPGAQVVELPYGRDAFAMTILLPDSGSNVNAFLAQLTPDAWNAAVRELQETKAQVHLPKFSLTWEEKLNTPLQALGMRQAFVPDGADFTRMSASVGRKLYVSFVKQKTFVDVNELGTEAAAVTAVGIGVTSLPPPPPLIQINRPFVFVLRERFSGTILFVGKIV